MKLDIYIYEQIFVIETWNLVHTLGGSIQEFWGIFLLVRFELVPVLNGLTWTWTFTYISKYLCYRLQSWHTPWGDQFKNFWGHFVWFDLNLYLMVWLEFGHLHISPNTCVWLELETWLELLPVLSAGIWNQIRTPAFI